MFKIVRILPYNKSVIFIGSKNQCFARIENLLSLQHSMDIIYEICPIVNRNGI